MKSTIFLILFSTFVYSQNSNSDLIKKYEKYDSINILSKEFPTKLIEGSGTIKNKKKQKIGNLGFSTEITKNENGKLVRIRKEQANHYSKKRKQNPKTETTEITIYFDENEIPEFSKYTSETYIAEKLIQQETNYYELKKNVESNCETAEIKKLLNEYKE